MLEKDREEWIPDREFTSYFFPFNKRNDMNKKKEKSNLTLFQKKKRKGIWWA